MIRKITIDDFEQWKKLRLEAVRQYPQSFGQSYSGVQKQDRKWCTDSLKNGDIFTYEQNGKMVAIAGIYSMKPENMRHRAVLFGMYVKPEFHKQGIASALINHIIDDIKPSHKQLQLTVTTTNNPAIELYKKHGFVIYGTDPDALLVDGKYYDEYLMIKKL
ncbi:MAG: GNAT family N-acetyltransferase [Rickettsiales bacterium]